MTVSTSTSPFGRLDGATKAGSLFSGTGALDMAATVALGCEPAWFVEHDAAAARLLTHHWPDVPNYGDITTVDWSTVEPVEVLVGGFPCQDISSAGKRAGIEGERSGLWTYFADAIRVLRPRYVLVENVSALVVRGLDRVLADLAALGFDAEWASVRASAVGAPHRRERVFLAAADTASERRGRDESVDVGRHGGETVRPGQTEPGRRDRPTPDTDSSGWEGTGSSGTELRGVGWPTAGRDDPEPLRPTPRATSQCLDWASYGLAIARWERVLARTAPRPTVTGPRGGQQLNPDFVEWMMGLPSGHVTAVEGLTRNDKLKLLGNGVVPQQGAAGFLHLLSLLTERQGVA